MLVDYSRISKVGILLIAANLTACFHDDDDDTANFTVTTPPAITLNASGMAPLAASVTLETDSPTRAVLTVSDTDSSFTIEFLELDTTHALPVLGLKANRTYTIDITLVDERERATVLATPLTVITDPLPDDMPVIELVHSDPDRMEPGFTLLDQFFRGFPATGNTYTLVVDSAGEIVWYSELGGRTNRLEPDGNMLYRFQNDVIEIDMLGNEVSRLTLDYEGDLHHDVQRTEQGTWISLARDTVMVEDFPTSETDPDAPTATTPVLDEGAIEFAADGSLLRQWPLTEIIHPQRIGYMSLLGTATGDPADWVHTNAILEDPRDNTLLISIRHQDAVIKFAQATGEIKWILGPHDNWPAEFQQYLLQPIGSPFAWQYHQHAPMYTATGTLVLFDNGNFRASPFTGIDPVDDTQNASRGVEYEIDEVAMTVRQVWEYRGTGGETKYTPALGDADYLPQTGNVLMTYGFITHNDGVGSPDLGYGRRHARIVEATRAASPERVFDLRLYQQDPESSILVYRCERVTSLYSPDVAITY